MPQGELRRILLRTNVSRARIILMVTSLIEMLVGAGVLLGGSKMMQPGFPAIYLAFYLTMIVVCACGCALCTRMHAKTRWTPRQETAMQGFIYGFNVFFLFFSIALTLLDTADGYAHVLAAVVGFAAMSSVFIHTPRQWIGLSLPPFIVLLVCQIAIHQQPIMRSGNVVNLIILYICLGMGVQLNYSNFASSEEYKRDALRLLKTDDLTGLSNRNGLDALLKERFEGDGKRVYRVSVLFIDLDSFKKFNDYYGHFQGDICLERVARALGAFALEKGAFAMRFGGEEFILAIFDEDASRAMEMAQKFAGQVRAMNIPHERSEAAAYVTVSIGVYSGFAADADDFMCCLKRADEAVYHAKEEGRNRVVLYDPAWKAQEEKDDAQRPGVV